MGESSATTSRAEDTKDVSAGASGAEGSQGVAGKSLPQWLEYIVSGKNPQGRVGDFMAAVSGRKLDKTQYARIAKLYKEFPGGLEALLGAICFVALKEPKGDQVSYLTQMSVARRKQWNSAPKREKGFSRDDYVES